MLMHNILGKIRHIDTAMAVHPLRKIFCASLTNSTYLGLTYLSIRHYLDRGLCSESHTTLVRWELQPQHPLYLYGIVELQKSVGYCR